MRINVYIERKVRRGGRPLTYHQLMQNDDGLALVIEEVRQLIGACGAFLTMQSGKGEAPQTLYVDRGAAAIVNDPAFDIGNAIGSSIEDGIPLWRDGPKGSSVVVLLLPVEQTRNHSRLVIGLLLDAPTAEARHRAELLYRERRPFAVGYFHLWQRSRLADQRAASFEAILDQTEIGVLMVDASSLITFANRAAKEILAAGDGISQSKGKLRTSTLSDGVNLQAALSHVIARDASSARSAPGNPLFSIRRKAGQPLLAMLVPSVNALVEATDVAATMYLVDPGKNMSEMLAPVCRVYRLSTVETQLACQLASGISLADAAANLRVKEATARSYLKTIFTKTSTGRQGELIVLLLSSVIQVRNVALQQALAMPTQSI